MTSQEVAIHDIQRMLEVTVQTARELGLVCTVSQKPLQPLAMGHYETVVEVRPKIAHGS